MAQESTTSISGASIDYGTGCITYVLSGSSSVRLGDTVVIIETSATEIKYDGIETMSGSTSSYATTSGARFDSLIENNVWGHDAMLGI